MDFSSVSIPLILIAVGGLLLITQRNGWLMLGGLLVQWAGIAWQLWLLPGGGPVAPAEIVTALGCGGIFGLTVWNVRDAKEIGRDRSENVRYTIANQVWLWAVGVVAGVAGFGLARLYPLGGNGVDQIAFYWIVLPAVLAIIVNGTRDPVKLGAGTISLLNGALLLVYSLSAGSLGVGLVGLAAVGRLVIAAVVSYSWLFIRANYLELDLDSIFDLRDSKVGLTKALVLVAHGNISSAGEASVEIEASGRDDSLPEGEGTGVTGEPGADEAGSDA